MVSNKTEKTKSKKKKVRGYLDKEEGHTIGLEGTTQLDKAELGVQLSHALKLAVLLEDLLVDFLLLNVLGGQKISQAGMVASLIS